MSYQKSDQSESYEPPSLTKSGRLNKIIKSGGGPFDDAGDGNS
jgi:hypothetical protein